MRNFDICNTSDNTEFDMVIFVRTRKRQIVLYFHVIQILIEKVPVDTVNERPGIILPMAQWGNCNVYISLGVLPLQLSFQLIPFSGSSLGSSLGSSMVLTRIIIYQLFWEHLMCDFSIICEFF